jgi:O-antigen ligase
LKSRYFERQKLLLLISTMLVTAACTLYPLHDLVFTRLGSQDVVTERISTQGRSWLDQQAIKIIEKSPFLGVGIGSFILELADTAVQGAPLEPVHNLILLITAELGIAGLLLILGFSISVTLKIIHSDSRPAILAGAMVTGLGVIGLFDHYFWTLAPGRVMLGLALGLWAGQSASYA